MSRPDRASSDVSRPSDTMAKGQADDPPSSVWLACAEGMPPLQGPAGTAERLLLHVHYGLDWAGGWVSRYRERWWDDILPDRVIVATYRAGTLPRWWSDVAGELEVSPRTSGARREVEQLLRNGSDRAVLEILRTEIDALILRTRITAEAVRDARTVSAAPTQGRE